MAMPHASYTLHCTSRPIPPSQKRNLPLVTGDIQAQNSNWNNGKMKIAYNTFTQQAIIVNVYLCSNFQEITMLNA